MYCDRCCTTYHSGRLIGSTAVDDLDDLGSDLPNVCCFCKMVGCAAHFLRRLVVSVRGPESVVTAFAHGERQQWGVPPVPCPHRGCDVHTYERATPDNVVGQRLGQGTAANICLVIHPMVWVACFGAIFCFRTRVAHTSSAQSIQYIYILVGVSEKPSLRRSHVSGEILSSSSCEEVRK